MMDRRGMITSFLRLIRKSTMSRRTMKINLLVRRLGNHQAVGSTVA